MGYGVEFGVVVDLELYVSALHRIARLVDDGDGGTAGRDIALDDIDFGIRMRARDHVLGTVVLTESLGMKQHGTGHG